MSKNLPEVKLKRRLVWRLDLLMAEHRVKSASELSRRLSAIGYKITAIHAARLVYDRPQRISSDLLDALVTIFDCTASDILAIELVGEDEQKDNIPGRVQL